MTSWPAAHQPVSPPLFDAGVIELAWWMIRLSLDTAQPWTDEALQKRLARLIGGRSRGEPPDGTLTGILRAWHDAGAPLAGLRALYPARHPPRLLDDEVHLFLQGILQHDEEGRQLAWQMMFRAGMDPAEARQALADFRLSDGVLPTGQWFSADDLSAADTRETAEQIHRLSNGAVLTWGELLELREVANSGSRIRAIKDVRSRTGCDLREAVYLIRDLQDGTLAPSGLTRPLFALRTDRAADAGPARRRLDACIDGLLRDLPLHWVILAMAEIREDPDMPTMAVGISELGQLFLFYSPAFVRRISREQCKGVLQHEINHVLLGHLRTPDNLESLAAWRCACECSANEFISYPLPGSPITIQSMHLPPMESTQVRYETLQSRDDLPEWPCDGMLIWRLATDPKSHTDHVGGQTLQPLHILKEAAELVGSEIDTPTLSALQHSTLPGLSQLLLHLDPESMGTLRWRELLRSRASSLHRRIATRRFPSRRFPAQVGIVPGRRRRREQPVVLAAVDTSASMTPEELAEITAELRGLTRTRIRVALVQCDTTIHEARWIDASFMEMTVKGRGGTDLRPPLAPDILSRYHPDLIVYFTDGYGPAPAAAPAGVDVLWVLTGSQPQVPARYGAVTCMRDRLQRQRVRPPA